MSRLRIMALCSALSLGLASTALAVNKQFLLLDPIRFFTDEDWEIETATAVDVAENNADGVSSRWENPDTRQSGTITPVSTYKSDKDETCRSFHFTNRRENLTSEMTIEGCRGGDGTWYITGPMHSP